MGRGSAGLLLLWLAGRVASAVPYTVQIDQDTFVRELAPDNNYGSQGALAVSGVNSTNGSGTPTGRLNSFVQFSTASLLAQLDVDFPGGWEILGVSLRVEEQTNPNNAMYAWGPIGGGTIDINWIPDDGWVDTTLTWNTAGPFLDDPMELLLDEFATVGRQPENTFVEHFCSLALTSGFLADLLAGDPVSLYLTTQDDDEGFQFAAVNNNTPSRRPYVVLEVQAAQAVPEPCTAWLLAMGLLGALRMRRRARE